MDSCCQDGDDRRRCDKIVACVLIDSDLGTTIGNCVLGIYGAGQETVISQPSTSDLAWKLADRKSSSHMVVKAENSTIDHRLDHLAFGPLVMIGGEELWQPPIPRTSVFTLASTESLAPQVRQARKRILRTAASSRSLKGECSNSGYT